MRTTAHLLAGICALVLVACNFDPDAVGSAEARFEADGSVCGPEFKIDEPGPQDHIQCPKGEMVARICVNAGQQCREAGKLRLEGKEYVVQDGDMITFRFNV